MTEQKRNGILLELVKYWPLIIWTATAVAWGVRVDWQISGLGERNTAQDARLNKLDEAREHMAIIDERQRANAKRIDAVEATLARLREEMRIRP